MIKIILIPGFVFLIHFANGQTLDNATSAVGINTNVSLINYTYRATLIPHYSMRLGKAKLNVGPTFLIASNIGIPNAKSPKLTGVLVSYSLMPQGENQKFTFFFSSDLLLQRYADFWNANAYDNRIANYTIFRYRNVEYLLQHYLGYGFQLKLGKRFYMTKGIGLGYYLSKLKGDELSEDGPEIENFDYRGYKNIGFTWQLKLGVGFRL